MRDVSRISALFVGVGITFSALLYLYDWSPLQHGTSATSRWSASANSAGGVERDSGNDQKLYTGSIIFVPPRGDLCSQWILDNRNGKMWDNGRIDCSVAAPKDAGEGLSAMRMRAIGKAFKD
jgi:hypothetical protein